MFNIVYIFITFEEFAETGNELDTASVTVNRSLNLETIKVVSIGGSKSGEGGQTHGGDNKEREEDGFGRHFC